MFGKLTWSAIPFGQPIPLVTGALVLVVILAVLLWVVWKGHMPYLWREWITSVDHKRIGVMYTLARMRDAAARLCRRHHDAGATGDGLSLAGLPAAGALQPDILRARHHHDLFRGDAVRDRADESRGAVAARRARRRVPDAQFGRLLADRNRRAAGQYFAGGRRVRAHRLAALSAAVGADLFARRRRRLLPVVAADLRRRHVGRRHQPRHHGAEDPHQGHDLHADADVLLDDAGLEPVDRRSVSDPDRDARDADPRPLSRLPLLHQRGRRQHDDVHEPDLGLGTSGGLHPGAARLRHFLRGGVDVLRQAAVRLPLDGARHHGDLHHFLHGVAASLLHHGRRPQRQRHLRHRQHDHRGAHGREDLQLAVHDVRRPHPLHHADDVVDRLHGDVHHRRADRRAGRGAARRFPAAQQPVPGRPFPQRHHRRRAVRRLRRLHLLVPEGVRLQPARGPAGRTARAAAAPGPGSPAGSSHPAPRSPATRRTRPSPTGAGSGSARVRRWRPRRPTRPGAARSRRSRR